jgi:REP element-mobilizing transposase RayT
MPHSLTKLTIHIIFSTKNREPWLAPALRPRLFAYMKATIERSNGHTLAINGMAEHVHILMIIPPDRAVSELVRLVKSNSSRWIHEEFPTLGSFAWQSGFSAFSVSESQIAAVRKYIGSQEEHHRKKSYLEELQGFFSKHGIDAGGQEEVD